MSRLLTVMRVVVALAYVALWGALERLRDWLGPPPVHGWTAVIMLALVPALVAGVVIGRRWAAVLALAVLLVPTVGTVCDGNFNGSDYHLVGDPCFAWLTLGQALVGVAIEAVVLALGVATGRQVRQRVAVAE